MTVSLPFKLEFELLSEDATCDLIHDILGINDLSWELTSTVVLIGSGIIGFVILTFISTQKQYKSRRKLMSLLTDDTIESISSSTKVNINIEVEITEIIAQLEKIVKLNQMPSKEFIEQLEVLTILSEEVKLKNNFSANMELANKAQNFRLKFKNYLQNEQIQEFEYSQIDFKQIKAELAIKITILQFTKLYREDNTPNKALVLYNFLRELSVLLEKNINYLSEKLLQSIRQFTEGVINNLNKPCQDEKLEWTFSIFKNAAKGILWEIDNHIKKRKENFTKTKSIIKFLEENPGWEWDDDLEECLKYVTEIR